MAYFLKQKPINPVIIFESNICRLCARTSESLIPIFDKTSFKKDDLFGKIKKCFPSLSIVEDDSKPKQVCLSCFSKLEICNELFDLSLAADSKFNFILDRHRLESTPTQDREPATDDGCTLKEVTNCIWSEEGAKTGGKTLASGNVIVVSKLDSNSLQQLQPESNNRDFVVMVELKYKDDHEKPKELVAISTTIDNQSTLDCQSIIDNQSTINCQSIIENRSTIDCQSIIDNRSTIDCQSIIDNRSTIDQAEIRENDDCLSTDFMFFQSDDSSQTKSPEKYLRLISNNADTATKSPVKVGNVKKKEQLRGGGGDEGTGAVNGKVLACSVCGKQFQRRTRLNSHMALHTEVRPHTCDQCGKAFAMRWDLTLHRRLHSGAYTCAVCRKSFTSQSKLDRHLRTHTGERPHSCAHCDKSFSDKRNLDNHLRTHTGEKPFVCRVCARAFRVRTHLTDHLRVHSKATPFKCTLCPKAFRWKANYNLHYKSHSGGS